MPGAVRPAPSGDGRAREALAALLELLEHATSERRRVAVLARALQRGDHVGELRLRRHRGVRQDELVDELCGIVECACAEVPAEQRLGELAVELADRDKIRAEQHKRDRHVELALVLSVHEPCGDLLRDLERELAQLLKHEHPHLARERRLRAVKQLHRLLREQEHGIVARRALRYQARDVWRDLRHEVPRGERRERVHLAGVGEQHVELRGHHNEALEHLRGREHGRDLVEAGLVRLERERAHANVVVHAQLRGLETRRRDAQDIWECRTVVRERRAVPENSGARRREVFAAERIRGREALVDLGERLLHRRLLHDRAREVEVVLHEQKQHLLGQLLLADATRGEERARVRGDTHAQRLLARDEREAPSHGLRHVVRGGAQARLVGLHRKVLADELARRDARDRDRALDNRRDDLAHRALERDKQHPLPRRVVRVRHERRVHSHVRRNVLQQRHARVRRRDARVRLALVLADAHPVELLRQRRGGIALALRDHRRGLDLVHVETEALAQHLDLELEVQFQFSKVVELHQQGKDIH